jgi:hypothetical protein
MDSFSKKIRRLSQVDGKSVLSSGREFALRQYYSQRELFHKQHGMNNHNSKMYIYVVNT